MSFDTIFPKTTAVTQKLSPIFLDGGLGTTLEDVFHADISHPLWSAKLVDKDEHVIVAAHLAFLRAGSQIILTSTYQGAYETFRKCGYADSDAERLMHKSVELAVKARVSYELELQTYANSGGSSETHHGARIALSLGPYGATLETAAEFTGVYPPPYGPPVAGLKPRRSYVPDPEENSYEDALASFHFTRLLVYARKASVWDAIDILAFETVPLVTEANAIRRAMTRLEDWFHETAREPGTQMKPWYISFVFPGPRGEFPQHRLTEERPFEGLEDHPSSKSQPYTPYEIARTTFSLEIEEGRTMAIPKAIGVNCTDTRVVARVIDGYVSAVRDLQPQNPKGIQNYLPWLVLCPNGGVAYDIVEKAWVSQSTPTKNSQVSQGEQWAKAAVETFRQQHEVDGPVNLSRVFGGLLVGGCCKTGPEEIRALRAVLSTSTP